MPFDRISTGICMLLSGPLILAGLLTSVWETDDSVAAYLRTYLVDPTRSQVSAVLLHFGFLLLLPTALGLGIVSHGAPRLRAVGLVAAVLGLGTLPGLLVVDFYSLALTHTLTIEQAVMVEEQVGRYPAQWVIYLPTIIGTVLSLVLLAIAAWRVGFAPWWSSMAVSVGIVAMQLRFGPTVVTIATTLLLAGLTDLGRRLILHAGAAPALASPAIHQQAEENSAASEWPPR